MQTLQLKYEMELAAHRDTTTALLAEKDRTIARLEELVAELRRQVQYGQQHVGDRFDHGASRCRAQRKGVDSLGRNR